ncbi:MAG: HtrA protease/chaperone protein [Chitinophagaceae bacterium]|nr:HtrA protease/chaperone protein [Chitinophagaceae bacterium]
MRQVLVILFLFLLPNTATFSHSKPVPENQPTFENGANCKKIDAVEQIISDAISIGAPTYNQGNHIGCYRIYEGAAYKILYKYGSKCKDIKNTLEVALEKSYGDYNASEKAWIMRMAFDKILGVPTTKG